MDVTNKNDAASAESLQVKRFVPATPERVFDAWTNPDDLQKWWGPVGVRCRSAEVDLRVGGQYRIANEFPDGTILWIAGEFEVVQRPRLLVYTWTVQTEAPKKERVTVQFEPHARGTDLILKHELIHTTKLRDQHQQGWLGCLDALVEFVTE